MGDMSDYYRELAENAGCFPTYGRRQYSGRGYYSPPPLPKKTLQDFADDAVEGFEEDEDAKYINRGVIKW